MNIFLSEITAFSSDFSYFDYRSTKLKIFLEKASLWIQNNQHLSTRQFSFKFFVKFPFKQRKGKEEKNTWKLIIEAF